MGAMVSQITSITSVYSTAHSGADKRKHQSSASLAFVRGIHRWLVSSRHKWSVTRKMFPLDDVIMRTIALMVTCMISCSYLTGVTAAAETIEKYQRDWKHLAYSFAKSKFLVTEKSTNGTLVTPGNPHNAPKCGEYVHGKMPSCKIKQPCRIKEGFWFTIFIPLSPWAFTLRPWNTGIYMRDLKWVIVVSADVLTSFGQIYWFGRACPETTGPFFSICNFISEYCPTLMWYFYLKLVQTVNV